MSAAKLWRHVPSVIAVSFCIIALSCYWVSHRVGWVPLQMSAMNSITLGDGTNECHWRARRHGCDYYNYPCATAPVTCTAGTELPKPCISAECKPSTEGNNCWLIDASRPYNVCKLTGDKNSMECLEGQERCTLEFKSKWNDPGAPSSTIKINRSDSTWCPNDPAHGGDPYPELRANCN